MDVCTHVRICAIGRTTQLCTRMDNFYSGMEGRSIMEEEDVARYRNRPVACMGPREDSFFYKRETRPSFLVKKILFCSLR